MLLYAERHKGSFDRVLMPLPERSWEFLPAAIASLDERGSRMIHYYVHVSEEQFKDKGWIYSHLGSIVSDKRFDVLLWKKVREVEPDTFMQLRTFWFPDPFLRENDSNHNSFVAFFLFLLMLSPSEIRRFASPYQGCLSHSETCPT